MSEHTPAHYQIGRGKKILERLFTRSLNGKYFIEAIDAYKGLKHIKEMLKGGQITTDEYEDLKVELLNR
jgi:hypothetical protein